MTRIAVLVSFAAAVTTLACTKPMPAGDAPPKPPAATASVPESAGRSATPDPAMRTKAGYDETRDPAKDLAALIPVARASHKRILLVVGGEWCVWCHYLHDFLDKDADTRQLWDDRFVTLHVNWSEQNENKPFLSQYPKIPGYPHIFVLDENGGFVHSQGTEILESGRGYSRDAVRAFLNKWGKA